MAGLQRSSLSFRRQGSSGLVWDDKFLLQLNKLHQESLQKDIKAAESKGCGGSPDSIKAAKSNDGESSPNHRKVADPTVDDDPPTSPRVRSSCCFGGAFCVSWSK